MKTSMRKPLRYFKAMNELDISKQGGYSTNWSLGSKPTIPRPCFVHARGRISRAVPKELKARR